MKIESVESSSTNSSKSTKPTDMKMQETVKVEVSGLVTPKIEKNGLKILNSSMDSFIIHLLRDGKGKMNTRTPSPAIRRARTDEERNEYFPDTGSLKSSKSAPTKDGSDSVDDKFDGQPSSFDFPMVAPGAPRLLPKTTI